MSNSVEMSCTRCGVTFKILSGSLERRMIRNSVNPKACRDCYERPAKLDLNAVWERYVADKQVAA